MKLEEYIDTTYSRVKLSALARAIEARADAMVGAGLPEEMTARLQQLRERVYARLYSDMIARGE